MHRIREHFRQTPNTFSETFLQEFFRNIAVTVIARHFANIILTLVSVKYITKVTEMNATRMEN